MNNGKIRLGIDARILSQAMNGVARYAILLLEALAKRSEFDVHLFTDTPLRREYAEYYSNFRVVLFNRKRFKKYWKNWALPLQLSKYRIDLYHAVWDKGVPLVSTCPVIMSIHDLYAISPENRVAPAGKKMSRLINLTLEAKRSNRIFTDSEATKREIVERLMVRPEKIMVTYLDCDRRRIETAAARGRAAGLPHGLKPREYFVSVIGRLDDVRKNVPFVIRSFSRFAREPVPAGRRYKLVLIGSYDEKAEYFGELKSLVNGLGLAEDVIFTGYVDDAALYSVMAEARLMIFASTFEGFGIPILEAFLLGVPVITSDRSSMPEIAGSGSALLIDPSSEKALAGAIASLAGDEALRKRLAENGRKRLGDFDWKITMENIVRAYHGEKS